MEYIKGLEIGGRDMTNGEKIRAMTDEELVKFLIDFKVCEHCDYLSADVCIDAMCEDVGRTCLLEWVKRPVED